MAIRRLLVGATLSVIASVGLPAAAAVAEPVYPPATGGLSVSATTVSAGGSVHVAGGGFEAGSTATVTVRVTGIGIVDSFTVTADDSGVISTNVLLSHSGTTTIVVTGVDPTGAARVLTSVVEATSVSASGSGSGSGSKALPDTGASIGAPLVLGVALLLGGAGAVLAGRRRRRRATAS
ncbi:MAG TPA: LPXTG cell wall anchor domain-containing protein [Mycobacteriales bacterium]|nr:LPXTG cell wall anchor domain-containing protein [Mycobacteriales bacterium]